MALTKEVIQFKIIAEDSRETFVEAVNEAIENGWQPYGDVCVTDPGRHADHVSKINVLGMAMVRYSPA